MFKEILLVGLGGAVGSVLRYLSGKLLGADFPWGTMLVNVAGCLLAGLLYGLARRGDVASPEVRLLLMVGFCGGFTTFSAFMNENLAMLRNGELLSFVLYATGSVVLGLVAMWFGWWVVRS